MDEDRQLLIGPPHKYLTARYPGTMALPFTPERREFFLGELSKHGLEQFAADATGIARSSVRKLLDPESPAFDAVFAEQYELAMERFRAGLVSELHRRAVQGVPRFVFYKGRVVHDDNGNPIENREYSDRLLEILLKRYVPEFREAPKKTQHLQANLHLSMADLESLTEEQREAIRQMLEQAEDGQ